MKFGINSNWFFETSRHFLRLQLGPVGLYLSTVRMRPNGATQSRINFRSGLLRRDGYRCRHCGCRLTYDTLTIHHIKPKRTFPELRRDPDNCICLCQKCHSRHHSEEDRKAAEQLRRIYRSLDNTLSVNPCAPVRMICSD